MSRLLLLMLLLTGSFTARATPCPAPDPLKKITIVIHADETVYIGRDTLSLDKLAGELQQRLWKSYLGTGKMYDSIVVLFSGEVMMGVRGAALDAVKEGQEKALREVCVSKYNQPFDKLSASQQKRVKRQFPVLFQEMKW